jgi:hypothetical protein
VKLCPHVLDATPEAKAWSPNVASIKIVTPNALDCFKLAPPDCEFVYRKYWDNQSAWANGADLAREVLSEVQPFISWFVLRHGRRPDVVCELLNEMGRGAWKEQAKQANEAAPVFRTAGVRQIGPSWSTGDYEEADWRGFVEATRGNIDGLSIHAYWAGAGQTEWNALRFAKYWKPGDPPVYITECGRDVVRDGPNGTMIGQGGWVKDGISREQYLAELLEYNARLEALPYVKRAYIFTAGKRADQPWGAYTTDLLDTTKLYSTPQPAAPDAPNQPGGETVSQEEFGRWASDVFKRHNVAFNADSALVKFWLEEARQGRYLGAPEGPEHPTENGQYILQEFAGAVLNCRVGEWIVRRGLPFA